MQIAYEEAEKGMRLGHGGPFGAVIVKEGKIIAKAHNEVLLNNDATCHAEIQAIRKASKKLKRFDLNDCELYVTGEPCPMCFGGIHWAKMKKVYYACSIKDAEKIGFDDKFIYDAILNENFKQKKNNTKVSFKQLNRRECIPLFNLWKNKKNKTRY